MRIVRQINNHTPRLLLLFAGWSTPPEIFGSLAVEEGTDLWICYDYRDLTIAEDFSGYQEIHLVAWSLGVWVATAILSGRQGATLRTKLKTALAINGTPQPIDDTRGIPAAIFRGTLDHINQEGMKRFNRRMCGSRETLAHYESIPARPLDEIREELQSLYLLIMETPPTSLVTTLWTHALISAADRIFPAENQRNYWSGQCPVAEINAPHYPFYLWKHWNERWKQ